MNKTLLIITLIISCVVIFAFYIYTQNTRYYIQTTSPGVAYKIDRKTGKTWVIYGNEEKLIESQSASTKFKSPEEKAIDLVKSSYALGWSGTVEMAITNSLQEIKGYLKVYGWKAVKFDDQTYVVSYTIDKDSGKVSLYFEANLLVNLVRKISDDPELEKRYGIKNKHFIK